MYYMHYNYCFPEDYLLRGPQTMDLLFLHFSTLYMFDLINRIDMFSMCLLSLLSLTNVLMK